MKNPSFNPRREHEKHKNKKKGAKFSVTHAEVAKAIQEHKRRGGLIRRLPDQSEPRRLRVQTGSWGTSAYEQIGFEESVQ